MLFLNAFNIQEWNVSLVLICTSVLLCVCMWVGGWLNVPVEFLFQNRISSRKRVYNARNVTTSIVIINSLKLIINSISALQVHCAEIWSFCHVKKKEKERKKIWLLLWSDAVKDRIHGPRFSILWSACPLFHCCIISFLNSAIWEAKLNRVCLGVQFKTLCLPNFLGLRL